MILKTFLIWKVPYSIVKKEYEVVQIMKADNQFAPAGNVNGVFQSTKRRKLLTCHWPPINRNIDTG